MSFAKAPNAFFVCEKPDSSFDYTSVFTFILRVPSIPFTAAETWQHWSSAGGAACGHVGEKWESLREIQLINGYRKKTKALSNIFFRSTAFCPTRDEVDLSSGFTRCIRIVLNASADRFVLSRA